MNFVGMLVVVQCEIPEFCRPTCIVFVSSSRLVVGSRARASEWSPNVFRHWLRLKHLVTRWLDEITNVISYQLELLMSACVIILRFLLPSLQCSRVFHRCVHSLVT